MVLGAEMGTQLFSFSADLTTELQFSWFLGPKKRLFYAKEDNFNRRMQEM